MPLTEQPQSPNKRLDQAPTRFAEFESQVWRKLSKTKSLNTLKRVLSWSYDMKGYAEQCVRKDIVSWQ